MLWAAQFTGPRLGGLLWALATWMKWVPVVRLADPGPRARRLGPGLAGLVDPVEHRPAAADDPAVPGAVRVRGPADPARLPRLPLGVHPVAVSKRPAGRAGSTTGRSNSAPSVNQTGASRNATRGPSVGEPALTSASTRIPPMKRRDDPVGRRRDVGDAHVPTRRVLRDDLGHERPVDGQEAAGADAHQDRPEDEDRRPPAPGRRSPSPRRR